MVAKRHGSAQLCAAWNPEIRQDGADSMKTRRFLFQIRSSVGNMEDRGRLVRQFLAR